MSRNVRRPVLAAIVCAALLAPLAAAAYAFGPVQRVDLSGFFRLRHETGPIHDLAAPLVNLGDLAALLVMLAAVCFLAFRWGRRREAIVAAVVVAGANVTTQALKVGLEHARHKAFEHGIELPWANSFPSGHTTAAASIAAALLLVAPAVYRGRAMLAGALLTSVVGISVIVLGWHYPSDVLGGLLVVGAWGFAGLAWLRFRAGRDAAPRTRREPRRRHLAVSTD